MVPSVDDVFALLEFVLGDARLALQNARPIAFDVGEAWLFDPRGHGALFRRDNPPRGALVVHCKPDLLARLVTDDDFVLGEDDDAWFEGNADDLLPLASVLEERKSALGIRGAS